MLIPNLKKYMKDSIQDLSDPNIWPHPQIEIESEPHFIFIATPPYSGSTALAKVLNSCHSSMVLQKRGEGQWLLPGMCANDRWDRDKEMNWDSVRAVWLQQIQMTNMLVQNIDFVIEKSPPNLVRLDKLIKVFPQHSLIAFNRDPFANCSSRLFRHHHPEDKHPAKRIELVKKLASTWLSRSAWVRKWMNEMPMISFTYESFCADPSTCIAQLAKEIPEFKTVDINKPIKVKDYQKQDIKNQNEKQIAKLTSEEIRAISEVLQTEADLVTFFGYNPTGPQ